MPSQHPLKFPPVLLQASFSRIDRAKVAFRHLAIVVGVTILLHASAFAQSTPTSIAVGSGQYQANVLIEFADAAEYQFDVAFDGSTTGLGLFDIIEADTTLQTERNNYGYGWFINGISFEDHTNSGYGGGENWWHYWIRDNDQSAWIAPAFGAADRIVNDGCQDAWIYGRAGAPTPEPTSILLMLPALLGYRRLRHHPQINFASPANANS